jgi:hypothetical protein
MSVIGAPAAAFGQGLVQSRELQLKQAMIEAQKRTGLKPDDPGAGEALVQQIARWGDVDPAAIRGQTIDQAIRFGAIAAQRERGQVVAKQAGERLGLQARESIRKEEAGAAKLQIDKARLRQAREKIDLSFQRARTETEKAKLSKLSAKLRAAEAFEDALRKGRESGDFPGTVRTWWKKLWGVDPGEMTEAEADKLLNELPGRISGLAEEIEGLQFATPTRRRRGGAAAPAPAAETVSDEDLDKRLGF